MVRLDVGRLDRELAACGLNQKQLAELSGVAEAIISRARHGQRIRAATLRKLVDALERAPRLRVDLTGSSRG